MRQLTAHRLQSRQRANTAQESIDPRQVGLKSDDREGEHCSAIPSRLGRERGNVYAPTKMRENG